MRNEYLQHVAARKPWLKSDEMVDEAIELAVSDATRDMVTEEQAANDMESERMDGQIEGRMNLIEELWLILESDESDEQQLKLIRKLCNDG